MISTNNIEKCYEVLLNVIKKIFCVNEYNENCNKCSLCHLIDINNLPSLKTIAPDGINIKKEAILELQSLFSKNSLYTNESIYIIKEAQKMNKESANTMLKFLEEPESSVIGFFITNDKDNVMLTIQSRCQMIEVNFDNTACEEYGITEEKYNNFMQLLEDFLYQLEFENKDLIINNKRYFEDMEKNDIICFFKMLLNVYNQELKLKISKSSKSSFSCLEKFTIENIRKKVELIIELLKEINYNINIELFIDKFILEMEVINNEII